MALSSTARALLLGAALSLTVRAEAAPSAERIRQLEQRLKTDPAFKIRVLAARKLGDIPRLEAPDRASAVEALRGALTDPHPLVRAMAVRSLARIEGEGARSVLAQVARLDDDAMVRSAARDALGQLAATPARDTRPLRVSLGRVAMTPGSGLSPDRAEALTARIHDAVEDRIQSHRPGAASANDPELRMDVQVIRRDEVAEGDARAVTFEVKVVLVTLPQAHLRHSARAVAKGSAARVRQAKLARLEEQVALEAVDRAVDDALASALAAR